MAPEACHDRRSGAVPAAWALLALTWAAALPPGPPAPPVCGVAGEHAARVGWTTWVECDPPEPSKPLRGAAPLLFGGVLDLNRAAPELLEVLPGIGPARARAIVHERARRPFASRDDLTRVRGIGPATVRALAGWAEARPPAAGGARAGSQKRALLLPNPSENSYKGRAGRASRGASRSPRAARDDLPGGRVGSVASEPE
jgi:competence protein ComEA